jgi:putative transposase
MKLIQVCQALEVSRSGYYSHQHKSEGAHAKKDAELTLEVSEAFDAHRRVYGSPRIMHVLRQKGLLHGKTRVARLMREQGLHGAQRRRFVPRTTISDEANPVSPNHLLKRPPTIRLNEVWLTDITYIATGEGWLYLAAEMDLHSRKIVGWSTHISLVTDLPMEALERALRSRPGISYKDLLHHSDRGCQYTSKLFRKRLSMCQVVQSMSRKGNCYDNAAMESFWATLKGEAFRDGLPTTRALARAKIFDFIETFYNPTRLHSSLNFKSPIDFEKHLNESAK